MSIQVIYYLDLVETYRIVAFYVNLCYNVLVQIHYRRIVIMQGHYGNCPSSCVLDDMHHFYKMVRDTHSMDRIMVRQVSVGDIIVLKFEEIWRWKIVKGRNGQLYLGYITFAHLHFNGSAAECRYVIAPSKDPKNPYLALYRMKKSTNDSFVL